MGQLLRTAGMTRTEEIPDAFYPNMSDRGLRPLLWERSNFLWTTVFNEQPVDDEIKSWCSPAAEANKSEVPNATLYRIDGSGFLNPEHHYHLERLRSELIAFAPTLIIPLGGLALWALTGNNSIADSRGAVAKASLLVPGTKLLPTLPPKHVLANYKMFSVVTTDLIKAQREAAFPEIRQERREVWLEPTIEDLWEFKKRYIDSTSIISVDIETNPTRQHITCVGFSCDGAKAITVPFVDYRKPNRSYWLTAEQELEAWEFLREVLEGDKPKLFQNGPYDCYYFWRATRIKVMNYLHDTRLQHHALYAELPKSLLFMGATYTNNHAWKAWRSKTNDGRDK